METPTYDGLIIDLDGVLYISESVLPGTRAALDRIREAGLPCRFLTNTTTRTPRSVVQKLHRLGFEVTDEEVFTPVGATLRFLSKQRGGTPSVNLVVRDSVAAQFDSFRRNHDKPDYVVIGDIGAAWSYPLMNTIFRQLSAGAELIAMHRNKFFQTEEGLCMDIGAFVAGLEYVTGQQARVIGKPSREFFGLALESLGVPAARTAMVGDDIESDVGGAQRAGVAGILVRTGKYRTGCEHERGTTPDAVLDSFTDLPRYLGL